MIPTGICRWLFLLISLSTWTALIDAKEMRIVCYYTNWSVYRPGQAKFSPQNINPYLCTHLVYAFGGFTKENTLKPFDKYQDIEKGGYAKFTGLKTYNKNLKTLIAIGGWNEGSSRFSPMVASADRRKELVKNTIKFLRQNHFDGLDLDWEYPTFRDGGKPRDRDNYAQLVKELREEFERESEKTGRPRLLLTMAVPAGIEYINKGYDVPKLTKYLDWMNILSYDYHSAFEPAVNHHAPLYSLEEDNEYNYDAELNIDYTIKHYLKLGADPSKLVLGIPTYGRSYTLFNPEAYEIGSPADGPGDMGEATRENGYLAYYEICEYIKERDWEVEEPNPNAMGPIAYKDNQWVGYDDENIVRKKAEYVAANGLGGIMFWAIDNDDFRGNCHGKPYPLIEAGKEALLNAYGLTEENLISPPSKPTKKPKSKPRSRPTKKTTTTEAPEETNLSSVSTSRRRRIKNKPRDEGRSSTSPAKRRKSSASKSDETSTYSSLKVITPAYTTPEPPPTPDMDGAFKCEDEGFFPHPKDCKKYFWCLGGPGDSGIVAHQFTCPAGLYFNKAADSCDYSQNVLCNKKLQRATTSTTEKSGSSTESTISEKSTQSSRLSTTRAPPKITAATSKTTINFRTTTTTTEAYEDEYEYEDDEEDEPNKKEDSEEDPRVIKELIDLIRKAGGIEQLEKQLKFGKDGSSSTPTSDATTPSVISKSLYERVLSKTSKSTLNALKKSSSRNSGGPQSSGEVEKQVVDRKRPQYRTLSRQRPSTESSAEPEPEVEERVEKEEVKEKKLFRPKSTLEYVNIRRPKASTTTEASDDDGFNRNKVLGELDNEDDDDEEEDEDEGNDDVKRRTNIPQYVNIRRQRPSTTEASATSSKYISIRRSTTVSSLEPEAEDDEEESENKIRRGSTTEFSTVTDHSTSLRYQTIRRGTTTATSVSEEDDEIVKRRSTTASPIPENDSDSISSTTQRPSTNAPKEETDDSIAKYQTIRRESTTQPTLPTSEESKVTPISEKEQAVNISESDSTDGTTLPQESISNYNILSTENLISSTQQETTESNIDATSNASLSTNSGTTDEIPDTETKKKRPVLFQPRPFSFGTNSSVKSTTPEPSTTTPASKISTTRPPFRVGYRKKSTTTPQPTIGTNSSSGTVANTSTPSLVVIKPIRRKTFPSRSSTTTTTTDIPAESQATSTQSPFRFTNRFKFIPRKPYLKPTTPRRPVSNSTDQTPTSTTAAEEELTISTDVTEPADASTSAQTIQQAAPVPQAKPSRKRPQVLRLSAQYSSRTTTSTSKPSSTTTKASRRGGKPPKTYSSPKNTNKKTVAITLPYVRGTYVTSQGGLITTTQTLLAADKFVPKIATAAPVVGEVYNSPQTITAQDFINKYTTSVQTSTRSRVRQTTTEIPLNIITPGQSTTMRRRRPTQNFQRVIPRTDTISTYRPSADYDYYDNIEASIVGKIPEHSKVLLHSNGIIECLDQGNFPHPVSCKKFIYCAKMDNDKIVGWEYTCPKNLSFDPIGGMCNWSAGLGCNES